MAASVLQKQSSKAAMDILLALKLKILLSGLLEKMFVKTYKIRGNLNFLFWRETDCRHILIMVRLVHKKENRLNIIALMPLK